ncbi:MAG: hypothetical protein ACOVK7_01985, partial [Burkholderiaceae bacterium]
EEVRKEGCSKEASCKEGRSEESRTEESSQACGARGPEAGCARASPCSGTRGLDRCGSGGEGPAESCSGLALPHG